MTKIRHIPTGAIIEGSKESPGTFYYNYDYLVIGADGMIYELGAWVEDGSGGWTLELAEKYELIQDRVSSFNINEWVKVKLTDFGMDILKQRHDELMEIIKANGGKVVEFDPHLDEDGYRSFQMWTLIETFGPHMRPSMVSPFEDNIIHICGWRESDK